MMTKATLPFIFPLLPFVLTYLRGLRSSV
jgi:hypothetical protein